MSYVLENCRIPLFNLVDPAYLAREPYATVRHKYRTLYEL